MAKKDIADLLMGRVSLIGEAVRKADHPPARGWPDFNRSVVLEVARFYEAGKNLWYQRPQTRSYINIFNIEPTDKLRDPKTFIIPVGKRETISAAKVKIENWTGLTPLTEKYESSRMKIVRREDVEFKNFKESTEVSFKAVQGSDTAQFKFEQEIKVGFEAQHGDETHEEKSRQQGTVTGADPTAAPGCDADYWRTWENQKSKVRHTGFGEVDFAFTIGTVKRGKDGKHTHSWEKHKNKYTRAIHFDSFWNDFIPMLRGEGRRDHDCYGWFKNHPAPDELLAAITAPLDLPFVDESPPFDDFSNIRGHKELIRGPNQEILDKLKKFDDAGVDASIT